MIKTKETKDKVLTFRVPYSVFERYEEACIEEHIRMSEILREAVERKVSERMKLAKSNYASPHQ